MQRIIYRALQIFSSPLMAQRIPCDARRRLASVSASIVLANLSPSDKPAFLRPSGLSGTGLRWRLSDEAASRFWAFCFAFDATGSYRAPVMLGSGFFADGGANG